MRDEPAPTAPTVARPASPVPAARRLGRPTEWLASCASTNDVAAARARAGAAAGLVVAADRQTAGRGRLGRRWHSPPGDNLYASLLLRPTRPAAEIPPLTLLAGAAVADAVKALGLAPRLKWPNDVELVDGAGQRRKLAGILTEMTMAGDRVEHVVIGVGVNVNAAAFPDDVAARAISLCQALGRPVDRARVLDDVLAALEPLYDEFERRGPAVAAAAFTARAAFPVRCRVAAPRHPGGALDGVAIGVGDDGALRVRDADGRVHHVFSGELLP